MDTLSELSARLPQLELRSAACSQAAVHALAAAEYAAEELATARAELARARAVLALCDSPRATAEPQPQRALASWEEEEEDAAAPRPPSAAASPLSLLHLPAPPSPVGLLPVPAPPPSQLPTAAPAAAAAAGPPLPRPIPWARAVAALPALLRAAPAPLREVVAAAEGGGGGAWGGAAARAPPAPLQPVAPRAQPAPAPAPPRSAPVARGLCAAFQKGACSWGEECWYEHRLREGEGAKARKAAAAPAPAAAPSPAPPPPPKRSAAQAAALVAQAAALAAQAAALAAQRAGAAAAAAAALDAVPPSSRAFAARLTARAPKDARTCISLLRGAALAGELEALVTWVQEVRGWRSLGVLLALCVEEGLALRVVVKVDRVSGGTTDLGVFNVTLAAAAGGGGGGAGACPPLRLAPSAVATRGASAHAAKYCKNGFMSDAMRRLMSMLQAADFPFAVFK